jgi:hypothetical protein
MLQWGKDYEAGGAARGVVNGAFRRERDGGGRHGAGYRAIRSSSTKSRSLSASRTCQTAAGKKKRGTAFGMTLAARCSESWSLGRTLLAYALRVPAAGTSTTSV